MTVAILKPRRESSLLRRHPWIFSGAIARLEGRAHPGQTVQLHAHDGRPLACGAWSPESQIRVRVWSFAPQQEIDAAFFRERLAQATALRRRLGLLDEGAACRLVNAESDGLPGVVVDRYADHLVCQFLSAGAERWKAVIAAQLAEVVPCRGIYERSDTDAREKEGLAATCGCLWGAEPSERVEIVENGLRFLVDLREGHKTGFYLDQRENRACLREYAAGAEVLNCFAYTGGFGVVALGRGAARVTNVDTSAPALDLAARNAELNGQPADRLENVVGDVFKILREYRAQGRLFDLVVLDPPKFAASAGQLARACRGYKDINLSAFRLLEPGGLLFTFSCSGLMDDDLFQKVVAGAALDSGRDARIVRRFSQAPDHPIALNFPEGSYLKGLLVQVV